MTIHEIKNKNKSVHIILISNKYITTPDIIAIDRITFPTLEKNILNEYSVQIPVGNGQDSLHFPIIINIRKIQKKENEHLVKNQAKSLLNDSFILLRNLI